MSLSKTIHPARTFLRGFAVGCVVISLAMIIINREIHKDRYWPVNVAVQEAPSLSKVMVNPVLERLDQAFFRDLSSEDWYAFIDGGLKALDDYGGYIPAESYAVLNGTAAPDEQTPFRIGILGTTAESGFIIDAQAPGSPSDLAGLRPGDRLVSVAGDVLTGLTGQEAYARLTDAVLAYSPGDAGIAIGVSRGLEQLEVVLTPTQSAPTFVFDFGVKEGVLHVVITGFYPGVTEGLRRVLENHPDIEAVVLDVRDNTGGRVTVLEEMVSLFMPEGTLVYASQTRMNGVEAFYTQGTPLYPTLPVVVLVNEASASSAEILAGFFQAHGRGVVIGAPTFGKGTVQSIIPLQDGGALRMTIGSYTDAAGNVIQDVGVIPDVVVASPQNGSRGGFDAALQAAYDWVLEEE